MRESFSKLFTSPEGRITYKGDIHGVYRDEYLYDGVQKEDGMAAADLEVRETEIERIERWRAEELERAGYPSRDAQKLAQRHDVDLHFAVDLIRKGCAPDLAVAILL